jgi:hypothetical protein
MFFQKVLKGIAGLTRQDADERFRAGVHWAVSRVLCKRLSVG